MTLAAISPPRKWSRSQSFRSALRHILAGGYVQNYASAKSLSSKEQYVNLHTEFVGALIDTPADSGLSMKRAIEAGVLSGSEVQHVRWISHTQSAKIGPETRLDDAGGDTAAYDRSEKSDEERRAVSGQFPLHWSINMRLSWLTLQRFDAEPLTTHRGASKFLQHGECLRGDRKLN